MLLGAGLGFAIYNPITAENPVTSLSAGALIIQGVSAVVSLWFGGWVAGRFTPARVRASARLHGFIVWCAATVAGVLLVSAGAGWMMGDISKLVGGGLAAAGQPAAAAVGGATDLAKDAIKQSGDTLWSFTDEATSGISNGPTSKTGLRAKREIGLAVARMFNPALNSESTASRAELVNVLVAQAGLSQADANALVTDWTVTYERITADLKAAKDAAEQKAREAADTAAKALSIFSLVSFAGFVFGAVAASCGACHGAKCAVKCENQTPATA